MTTDTMPDTTATPTDTSVIVGEPSTAVTLKSGTQVDIQEVRLLQMCALIQILTDGAEDRLMSLEYDPERETDDEFLRKLLVTLALAVPKAGPQAAAFIRSVAEPHGLRTGYLTKSDKLHNDTLRNQLRTELENPRLQDTLRIMREVIRRETPNLRELGKELASMLPSAAAPTGATPNR